LIKQRPKQMHFNKHMERWEIVLIQTIEKAEPYRIWSIDELLFVVNDKLPKTRKLSRKRLYLVIKNQRSYLVYRNESQDYQRTISYLFIPVRKQPTRLADIG